MNNTYPTAAIREAMLRAGCSLAQTDAAMVHLGTMEPDMANARLVALLEERNRTFCPVIEWPEGVRVDECTREPPCPEHQRRYRLRDLQPDQAEEISAPVKREKERTR